MSKEKIEGGCTIPPGRFTYAISEHACFACNGVRVMGIVYHEKTCSVLVKAKAEEPKPETWRDRKPLL